MQRGLKALTGFPSLDALLGVMGRRLSPVELEKLRDRFVKGGVEVDQAPALNLKKGQLYIGRSAEPLILRHQGRELQYRGQVFKYDPQQSLDLQIDSYIERLENMDKQSAWLRWLLPQAFAKSKSRTITPQNPAESYAVSGAWIGASFQFIEAYHMSNDFEDEADMVSSGAGTMLSKAKPVSDITCTASSAKAKTQVVKIVYADGTIAKLEITPGQPALWVINDPQDIAAQKKINPHFVGKTKATDYDFVEDTNKNKLAYEKWYGNFCKMPVAKQKRMVSLLRQEQRTSSPSISDDGFQ